MARSAPRTPALLFGFLSLYILLQSIWWLWLLISKDRDIFALQQQILAGGAIPELPIRQPKHTFLMVFGEGLVFLLLMMLGLWITFRTLRRELSLARQQRDFLMAASHELRTPIAALKLHLQTLQRPNLDAGHRELLSANARQDVDRLHQLTERILLASRLEEHAAKPQLTAVDAAKEAGRLVDAARASYGKGHHIVLTGPESALLRTDLESFRSILGNLLENACHYSPAGSTVTVQVESGPRAVRLRVSDTGPGVPAGDRQRIFDKFFRSGNEETRDTKGTGLGLFIVRESLRDLGGHVEYRPVQPHGSTFVATFPIRA
jgi:signal transduction histidine kinase